VIPASSSAFYHASAYSPGSPTASKPLAYSSSKASPAPLQNRSGESLDDPTSRFKKFRDAWPVECLYLTNV